MNQKQNVIILSLDTLGDITLRQQLFTSLVDKGYKTTVVVQENYAELIPLLDDRINVLTTKINPHLPPAKDTAQQVENLRTSIAKSKPKILVCANYNRTYIDEWLLRYFPDTIRIGFSNDTLSASLLDQLTTTLINKTEIPNINIFSKIVTCNTQDHETAKNKLLFETITNTTVKSDMVPTITLSNDIKAETIKLLKNYQLKPNKYILGCPAGNANIQIKSWPIEHYVNIINYLKTNYNLSILLTGIEKERPFLEEIVKKTKFKNAQIWIGSKNSLLTLLGLISQSCLYLGSDTGPMHFASALNIPVVALFGGGNWPRFLPTAAKSFVATQKLPCFDNCYWQCWLKEPLCIKLVDAGKIKEGIKWILSNDQPEQKIDEGLQLDPLLEKVFAEANTYIRTFEKNNISQLQEKEKTILNLHQVLQNQSKQIASLQNLLADQTRIPFISKLIFFPYKYVLKKIGKSFAAPQLGIHNQYPAKKLTIPKYYRKNKGLKSSPKISIVTPSFNQGQFLEKTIKSVLEQNYPALEYIIQDGGSTDNSIEILKHNASSLSHWESKSDNGQANAINLGFQHATGEIMAYLNSDDLLLPGSLHYIANFFTKHPKIDVVYGHRILINEHDQEIGRWVLPPHDNEIIYWRDYIPQETLFWRRRLWDKTGGYIEEKLQFAMDWDLLIQFCNANARFYRLPRFLGAFRIHTKQKNATLFEERGQQEVQQTLERYHGHKVSNKEIDANVKNYLLQHSFYNFLYKKGLLRY